MDPSTAPESVSSPIHPPGAVPSGRPDPGARAPRFPAAGVALLVLSVIGSALMFWRPWSPCSDAATCSIAPGSIAGWVLTGSLIMMIIALSALAIGVIRRVDRSRAES